MILPNRCLASGLCRRRQNYPYLPCENISTLDEKICSIWRAEFHLLPPGLIECIYTRLVNTHLCNYANDTPSLRYPIARLPLLCPFALQCQCIQPKIFQPISSCSGPTGHETFASLETAPTNADRPSGSREDCGPRNHRPVESVESGRNTLA